MSTISEIQDAADRARDAVKECKEYTDTAMAAKSAGVIVQTTLATCAEICARLDALIEAVHALPKVIRPGDYD